MDGMMPVDELKARLSLPDLPAEGSYHTLAGLVLALLRRVPRVGDRIVFGGWRFEVLEMDGRRVDKVRASREPAAEALERPASKAGYTPPLPSPGSTGAQAAREAAGRTSRTTQELPAGLPVMPRLCVVAPVYNEAECLREFQRRLAAAMDALGEWRVVYVDDGSVDGSPALLQEMRAARPSAHRDRPSVAQLRQGDRHHGGSGRRLGRRRDRDRCRPAGSTGR